MYELEGLMKAVINRDGTLIVSAEDDLEAFAIQVWSEKNRQNQKLPDGLRLSWHLPSGYVGRKEEKK